MNEFVPLIGSQTDRGIDANVAAAPTKDQLFQNCLFYPVENAWTGKKTIFIEKRPGVPASGTTDANYVTITGFYHWRALGTTCRYGFYTPAGAVYRMTIVDSGGENLDGTVSVSPIFHVSEGKNGSGVTAIFYIAAGATNQYTSVYMWADGDVAETTITVPSGSCGHLAHLDGYVFVGNVDGRIYNSGLNAPTTGYTDFIGADIHPDVLVTVYKYKNYLLGFGTNSVEWYRIGEQTTGSPLQRIPELFQKIGMHKTPPVGGIGGLYTGNAPPIVDGNNTIYWIAQTEDGLSVYTMDDTRPKKISDSTQEKYLQSFSGSIKYVEVGKRKLLLVSTTAEDSSTQWLCYDIEFSVWTIWTSTEVSFAKWNNTINGQGLIMADGNVYYEWTPDDDVPYLDITDDITRKIRTSIIDGDTNDYKDFPSLSIIGDKQTTTSNITVKWTKDDYQTWNTGRTIDMSSANPKTHALGVARRIAFELTETNNNAGRLRGLDLEYNVRR